MASQRNRRWAEDRLLLATVVLLALRLRTTSARAHHQDDPYLPPANVPSPLPYAPTVVVATAPNPTVPLAKFDCNLLAARKRWTGIKTCNPPPKCPLEDAASTSYQTKKGPYWCNKDGHVTILYLNFKRIKSRLQLGTLPSSWGYFPALRILTVMANGKLTGRVPESFSLLTTLSELDLGFNPNLYGGIPATLASSDNLTRLRVASSGLRARLQDFNRQNFDGNPVLLIVSRSRPEICQDYGNGYPVLVSAVYWSTTRSSYVGATLAKCK